MNRWHILSFFFLLLLFAFSTHAASPQDNPRSDRIAPQAQIEEEFMKDGNGWHGDPFVKDEKLRRSRPEPNSAGAIAYKGGPDTFGYTYDTDLPFDWTDATQGYRTNITSDNNYGYINFGFEFPYYEQNWTGAYVSTNGFLSFGQASDGCCGNYHLPMPRYPNNIIAPYWANLEIIPADGGGIWVLPGGVSPNRYLIIEWHSAYVRWTGGKISFAVKLMENGDIYMSYADMDEQDAGSVGIEDSTGYVGLNYEQGAWVESFSTFGFFPPDAQRGALAYPPRQGELVSAGTTQTLPVNVRNFGRLGADTLDIEVSSRWAAEITWPDGSPLSDTNSNGKPDSGILSQGETTTLSLSVKVPAGAAVGTTNLTTVHATSAADANATSKARVESTVPAPYAQAIVEDYEGRAMGLNLLHRKGQRKTFASAMYQGGDDPAIAEIAGDGFVYAWTRSWATAANYEKWERKIFIARTDLIGNLTRNIQIPFDPGGAFAGVEPTTAYDWDPALAVAPNGNIGLVWRRYLYERSAGLNMNVFFAVLDRHGNLISGPINITNYNTYNWYGEANYRYVYEPKLAATGDGRFVMSWRINHWISDEVYTRTVYYAVAGNHGSVQRSAVPITAVDPDSWSTKPSVAAAPNNQATLFYIYDYCPDEGNCDDYIAYSVIDANNNLTKKHTELFPYGSPEAIDSTLLSDGRTIAIWSTDYNNLRYVILSPQLTIAAGQGDLSDPLSRFGIFNASVAPAGGGRAVVTWTDEYDHQISYALLNSAGDILTQPTIAYRGRSLNPYVYSGYNGNGTTSYSWQPPSAADAAVNFTLNPVGGSSGYAASIPVSVSNLGQAKATGVTLTVTLPSDLSYAGDNSDLTPTIAGNKVTWSLPDLALLESFDFEMRAEIPANAALGKRYNVNASVDIQGSDAGAGNNTAITRVMVSKQALMSLVMRP